MTRDLPLTPLAGRGIVITRPDRQAAGLAALIDAAGGHALRYATIEIEPLRTARLDALLGRLGWRAWRQVFAAWEREDGLLPARFEIVYGHAWKTAISPAASTPDGGLPIRWYKK